MKTIALFVTYWLISTTDLIAQKKKDTLEDIAHYERIIEIPGKNKNEIYLSVLKWAANFYKSATKVIDHKDQESGEVVIKAIASVPAFRSLGDIRQSDIKYSMQVSIKDNKIRIVFDYGELMFSGTSGTRIGNSYVPGTSGREVHVNTFYNKESRKKDKPILKNGTKEKFENICQNLKLFIESNQNNDW